MKKGNKFFKVAGIFAIPTLVLLILVAVGTIIKANTVITGNAAFRRFPGFFSTMFFDYSRGSVQVLNQSIGNFFVYLLFAAALIFFILALVKIKHNRSIRAKAAVLACFLLVPATLGLIGGIYDFIAHAYKILVIQGSATDPGLAFLLICLYLLDVLYVVLAVGYIVGALKEAALVNKGILPQEEKEEQPAQQQTQPCCSKEEREKEHEKLLKEIRQIVREELDRLDRIAIITETEAPAAEEEPAEEPVEEEAPEVEEVEEAGKKIPSAPRVPFAQKIVDADKEIQEKYNELKNEILAYGPSSRLSVAGDTFRLHRKAYVKITLVGKTLKVYFALNPNDYVDSPIPVFDAGDKSSYEDVPALLKVRSALSVKRAKELIDAAFAADGVEKGEVGNHNHVKDIRAELKAKK